MTCQQSLAEAFSFTLDGSDYREKRRRDRTPR